MESPFVATIHVQLAIVIWTDGELEIFTERYLLSFVIAKHPTISSSAAVRFSYLTAHVD